MSCGTKVNLHWCHGDKFDFAVRIVDGAEYSYATITNITKSAPVVITAVAHDIPHGWPVAVVSVQGMTEINALNDVDEGEDWHFATVVDVDTIKLNDVNSLEYSTYTSGGALQYYTPHDLSTDEATFTIYDEEGGTAVLTLTSNPAAGVVVNNSAKIITATIEGTDWDSLEPDTDYWYEMELWPTGEVSPTPISYGKFYVDH